MNGPRGLFVTGTDTGAGKTVAACALIAALRGRGLRVAGMKPVASGCVPDGAGLRSADALALIAASGLDLPYDAVNPYPYAPPVAPHIAAAEAGRGVDFGVVAAAYRTLAGAADVVVVEGIGGWRVPLGGGRDVAALAAHLMLPVLLVVGLRLGCLSHARLTAEAIASDGVPLAGWVGSAVEAGFERAQENLATLAHSLPAPCLGLLRHRPRADPDAHAKNLDTSVLWP